MEPTIARSSAPTIAVPHASASRLVIAATAVVVAIVLGGRLDYVPIWDGFVYASAIQTAAAAPFDVGNLRLAGHTSQAYALLLVVAQSLAPDVCWPILLVNAALLAIAGVGFHRLAELAFPDADHATDRALLTAAFLLQPALLAAVVQPGLDLPMVPGCIWATVFVLERRWLAAAAAGVALVFSKETGALLYAALVGSWVLRNPRYALGVGAPRADAVRRLAILALPAVAFALYLGYRMYAARGEPAVWNAGTAMINQPLWRQLLVPRIDRYVASYVAIMLVLNFAWIMTLAAGAGAVVTLKRAMARGPVTREVPRWLAGVPGFVALLAVATAFVLTRFASYANARYLLAVAGPLLILFLAALMALRVPTAVRRGVLTAFVLLVGVSVVRTVDPVSRAVFGTFPVGEHAMLRMTSITHECCGSGRDQLGYNLEFTTLAALTDDALATMRVGESTLVVIPDSTSWSTIPPIDPVSGRRTPDFSAGLAPLVIEADSAALYAGRRTTAVYVALPNGSPDRGLAQVAAAFAVGPERRVRRDGYWLSVYRLDAKPAGAVDNQVNSIAK